MSSDIITMLYNTRHERPMRQDGETTKCPICGTNVSSASFADELSEREYIISGLCQVCQDLAFGGDND